jgi:hypothetical protein
MLQRLAVRCEYFQGAHALLFDCQFPSATRDVPVVQQYQTMDGNFDTQAIVLALFLNDVSDGHLILSTSCIVGSSVLASRAVRQHWRHQ